MMSKVPGNDLIDPPRNQFEFMYNKVLEAQATADRLHGLLRESPKYPKDVPTTEIDIWYWFKEYKKWSDKVQKELDDTALEDRDG